MPKQRIFIAVQIPDSLKNILEKELEKRLNKKSENSSRKNLIRFIKKENWHITVSFLGYLSSEEIEIIKKIIAEETTGINPFYLQPEKIIWAPYGPIKRMIWLDFKKSPQFEKLKNNIENAIISWQKENYFNNFKREQRQNNVHLTLAKFEPRIFKNIQKTIPPQGIFLKEKGDLEVKNVDIMESRLSGDGAEYKTVLKIFFSSDSLNEPATNYF